MKGKLFEKASQIVTSSTGRALLKLKKHSPEILVIGGVAGVIVATVMACKATSKLDQTLEEVKDEISTTIDNFSHETEEGKIIVDDGNPEYTKAVAKAKIKGGVRLVRLYAPSFALGFASICCVLYSHGILKRRNAALAAAYSIMDESYKKYRERVISEFGEQVDRRMRFGERTEEIEVTETNEKGEEEKKKILADLIDRDYVGNTDYARFFDESSIFWCKDAETNLKRVLEAQRFCNEKLKARGHLFLNEAYDELDIPRTAEGQFVGWIYKGYPSIDFGVFNEKRAACRRFVNGYENVILIDPNVDGIIYDLI